MSEHEVSEHLPGRALYQRIGLILGPVLAAAILLSPPPAELTDDAWRVVALAVLMASWWATEAIPVPATSLLPLVWLPLFGITDAAGASTPYTQPVIFLLLGGFIIAMAMQRWHLHRRIALHILSAFGGHPAALVGGFMAASALLSMWISNTATTLMMLPIAVSVAQSVLGDKAARHPFTICLLLGVAYAASIGGLGTIIGTPPNAFVVAFVRETQGVDIAFIEWMAFGVPAVLLMVPAAWFVLTRLAFRFDVAQATGGHEAVAHELKAMGPLTVPERRTAIVFGITALAWMSLLLLRELPGLQHLSNMGIAVAGALAMFLVPAGGRTPRGTFLLDWDAAVKLPWGVVLLFGGGLSLAGAISDTGLAAWLGDALSGLTTLHLLILTAAVVAMIIFLTELTSNTATVAALVPVLAALAAAADFDPILLAAPAALAGSCAFMLPVATAPNAIVFASGHVTIPNMVTAGFRLNLLGIVIISALCYALVPLVFG